MLKKKLNKYAFILISLSIVLIGCKANPILNIDQAEINTASERTPSLKYIAHKIKEASSGLRWKARIVKAGHIIATLNARKHMAQVDIKYTKKHFSITYKDSKNLKYNNGTIHKSYNVWVQRLRDAITTQVYND